MFTNENIKTYLFKDNVYDNHYLDLGSVAVMALSFVAILFDFWLNPEFKESLKKAMHEKTMSIYSFLVILARLFAVLAFACTVSAISKPFLGVLERSLQTTLQGQIQQALPLSTECSAPPQFPDLFSNAPNISEFGKIIRRIGDPRELPWKGTTPDGWISLNDKYFVSSRDPTHPTLTYLLLSISKLFIQGELHVIKIKDLEAQLQALEKASNKTALDINAVNITWEKNNQTIANQLQALEKVNNKTAQNINTVSNNLQELGKANNKTAQNINAVNVTWEKNNQTIANQFQALKKSMAETTNNTFAKVLSDLSSRGISLNLFDFSTLLD
jgi:hypothetical protein